MDKVKHLRRISGRARCRACSTRFCQIEVTDTEFKRLCQSLEPSVILKLHAIIELAKNDDDKFENFIAMFVDVRSSIAREVLESLNLSSKSEKLTEDIVLWGNHMEFVLKDVLQAEYELCRSVFDKFGLDISMSCFAEIVANSRFLDLLRFGNRVVESKKDAFKLLKLLDVFAVLDKLRLDFNRVFGGEACLEIRKRTRDLVRQVVDGACVIFFELSLQVKVQGSKMARPFDGGVHRFVKFVANYCIMLLQDDYRLFLSKVLSIHRIWSQKASHDMVLREEFGKIVEAIEVNLETWSKTFEDTALSYFFLMNNYRYLHGFLEGKAFGDVMGDDWLSGYVSTMENYAKAYVKESWGKLPAILSEVGLMLFFPDRTINEDLVKGILTEFNIVFEDMYKSESEWILFDDGLREKAHELIVQTVVPAYRSYLHDHAYLMGKGSHVKYSAARVEAMLRSLFQPKMTKSAGKHKSPQMIGSGQGVLKHHHRVREPKLSHSANQINTGLGVWIPCR